MKLLKYKECTPKQKRVRIAEYVIGLVIILVASYINVFWYILPASNNFINIIEKTSNVINHLSTESATLYTTPFMLGIILPTVFNLILDVKIWDFLERLSNRFNVDLGFSTVGESGQ